MLDIIRYEAMAMLELADSERQLLGERLDALAGGFDALDEIGTNGVEPLVTVLELHNVMREDRASKLLPRDEMLANAPEQYDGYFQVPGTLD